MASPTLLTDESLRIYKHDQRLVILSVSEDGLRIGKDTDYPTFEHTDYTNGVYLFAESVAATSDIVAPHGLTIATWSLVGPSTGEVKLDASGIRGADGTPKSPDGGPGGGGGTVGLYVQDLGDVAAKVFTPLARGGDGGDTHTAGKKGGDGGNGGSIITVLQPTYIQLLTLVQNYLDSPDFRSTDVSQNQAAVTDSDSLYDGAQTLVNLGQGLTATQDTLTRIFGQLSCVVDKVKQGEKCTVADLLSAAVRASTAISLLILQQGNLVAPDDDQVRGGYPGTGKGVQGDPGKQGKGGDLQPTFLGDSTTAQLTKAQLPFAHHEQRAMPHARRSYDKRFPPLPLRSSNPLYKAYEKSTVMPSTGVDDLNRILDSAHIGLVESDSETDYSGYTPRRAPTSYYFDKGVLDDALADLTSIETAYIQHHTALAKQEDLTDKLKLAYSNTSRRVSRSNGDMEDILQDLNKTISGKTPVVPKAQKQLKDAYTEAFLDRSEFHFADAWQNQDPVTDSDSLYDRVSPDMSQSLIASQATSTQIFGQPSRDKIKKGEKCTTADRAAGASTATYRPLQQENLVADDDGQVRAAYPGAGKGARANMGKKGMGSKLQRTFLGGSAAVQLAQAQLPFAHPEQCAMLLNRANTFFYMNSPILRSHARRLYERLIKRLSFLPLQSSDPLYQVYQKSTVMPPTSVDDLKRILDSANTELVKLNTGKTDYNGYTPRWVPRASYDFYKSVLDDALTDLTSFETAYIQYHTALAKQEDLTDKVKLAYSNTSQMVSRLNEDIEDIWSTLQDLNRKISAKTPVVQKAQKELKVAYEAEEASIEEAFSLSIPQLINAFTSIAMAPHKEMVAAEATDLVFKGFTSIPTTDGGSVTKEYLASEIKQSEATISNIKLELKTKIDGTYQLDEAFSKRLVVEKEQMLAQLDKFSDKALGGVKDADTRKDFKTKFDAYIDAVTSRNDLIFQYNVNADLLLKKTDEKTQYENEERKLENKQITTNNPDLPAITAYIDAIYQSSRSRVMKLLDILLRSLYFRMLRSHDVLGFAFNNQDEVNVDSVPLSLSATMLSAARGKIQEQFNKGFEEWGVDPARFPNNFDTDEGKRYYLDRFDRQQLIEGHSVTLTIKPVLQSSEPAGDFRGCCNVRVYRARFGFTGLKTASGVKGEVRVHVTLTHGGNETIVNRSNEAIQFEHDPISTPYSFRMQGDKLTSVVDNGNIGQADVNQMTTSYAAPGPFAEWTVGLDGTEFEKLDFSGVKEAFFDFCGTNYAYVQL